MKKAPPRNYVHLGDCLSFLQTLPDSCIDLAVADPPFNIGKKYDTYGDDLRFEQYLEWCHSWLSECIRVLKPTGSLYLFNYPENNAYLKMYLDQQMKFRRWITWHYNTNTGHSKRNYTRTQHSILFYTKDDEYTFNKQEVVQPYKNPTDRRIQNLIRQGKNGTGPYDVFIFNIVKNVSREKTDHIAQLPVRLIETFVKASSNPGDLVFDPFMGSGTTAVAAKRNGRYYLGCEISEKYHRIIKERLKEAIPPLSAYTVPSRAKSAL